MDTTINNLQFSELLGLSELGESEREELLSNIGSLILESVLTRVIAGMTEEETAAFEQFVSLDPSPDALLNEMRRMVPDIDTLVTEETNAFKNECVQVLERARAAEEVAVAV